MASVVVIATIEPKVDWNLDPPIKATDSLVSEKMWIEIFCLSGYQIMVLMAIVCFGDKMFGLHYSNETPFYVTEEMLVN